MYQFQVFLNERTTLVNDPLNDDRVDHHDDDCGDDLTVDVEPCGVGGNACSVHCCAGVQASVLIATIMIMIAMTSDNNDDHMRRRTSTADRVMFTWLITSPWTVTYWPIMYLLLCQGEEEDKIKDWAKKITEMKEKYCCSQKRLSADRKRLPIDHLSFVKLSPGVRQTSN